MLTYPAHWEDFSTADLPTISLLRCLMGSSSISKYVLKHKSNELIKISTSSLGRDPTEDEHNSFMDMCDVLNTIEAIDMMSLNWGDAYIEGIYIQTVIHNTIKPRRPNVMELRSLDSEKLCTYSENTTIP